jgi:U2-associated protein SR140
MNRNRYTGMTGAQIERQRAKERGRNKARLRRDDEKTFLHLLETLSVSRESIRVAMGFALDHAEFVEDIVALLYKSIFTGTTSLSAPDLVARLFLVSDLLHNSGAAVKNASNFRPLIQVSSNMYYE